MSASRSQLVKDTMVFVRRYVVVSREQLLVIALWAIHTHCVEAFDQTPYLAITSPEKQCGKSRLLETLELVVARPWVAITPSEPVVYRRIAAIVPTLMLDEVDTIFNPRSAERYEGLRALLNNGNRKTAIVPRCIGTSNEIAEFSTFCPKALSGIGTLPETIADRCVPIRLERRVREPIHRFHRRDVEPVADELRERIEAWCEAHAPGLENKRPEMPDALSDRMQDGCECLAAIADALGCGTAARKALVTLLTSERADSEETMRLKLLRDVSAVFNGQQRNMSTVALLARLCELDEAPWSRYYGRQLDEQDLAKLLRPYGIKSTTVRIKRAHSPDVVKKGYRRKDLAPVFERYLQSARNGVTDVTGYEHPNTEVKR